MPFNTTEDLYHYHANQYSTFIPFSELAPEAKGYWKQYWLDQCDKYNDNNSHEFAH